MQSSFIPTSVIIDNGVVETYVRQSMPIEEMTSITTLMATMLPDKELVGFFCLN